MRRSPDQGRAAARGRFMAIRAILFDFDGVIADTENIHIVAWQRTLSRMGWLIPDEAAAKAAEVDDRLWLTGLFATKSLVDGDIEGWCALKQELATRLFAEVDVIYPGVSELVDRLRGRFRLGVVSTTWRENVAAVLGRAGLSEAFEFVIAKEDVVEVKPDPECYRRALSRMGLDASEVIAVEDSPGGLSAAIGAGLATAAVGHRRPEGEWSAPARWFLPSLRSADRVVNELGLESAGDRSS
ncbi:MAG: HAD family phosphatase [Isosphaeraceae bacterium]|nr:HAD family phosphatase [Isosphaeraceae bacterium]